MDDATKAILELLDLSPRHVRRVVIELSPQLPPLVTVERWLFPPGGGLSFETGRFKLVPDHGRSLSEERPSA